MHFPRWSGYLCLYWRDRIGFFVIRRILPETSTPTWYTELYHESPHIAV